MRLLHVLLSAAALALFAGPLIAHEGWLSPDAFHLAAGGTVHLSLHVGDDFQGDARPFDTSRTAALYHFSVAGLANALDLVPEPPGINSLEFSQLAPGTHVFAVDTQSSTIELPADKFLAYLKAEGLDAIVQLRHDTGHDHAPGRERSRRFVKTIVRVGPASDDTYAVVAGQQLEIVPASDPFAAHAGAKLSFTVLYDGEPLAGAEVHAWSQPGAKSGALKGRTDASGSVTFILPQAGSWLVAVVNMIPLRDVPGLDWESSSASLTFEVAP